MFLCIPLCLHSFFCLIYIPESKWGMTDDDAKIFLRLEITLIKCKSLKIDDITKFTTAAACSIKK